MKHKLLSSFSVMGITLLIATTAAFAADTYTDANYSSNVSLPTEVGIGANSFQIRVWASGNVSGDTAKAATVVTAYDMDTNGAVTAGATSTEVSFAPINFGDGINTQACAASPKPLGCRDNPHVVNATLNVAAGTPNNTAGTVVVSITGVPGLTADPSPDSGYVIVKVSTACTISDVKAPMNVTSSPDFDNISIYKYGARGVVPVKFDLTCGTNKVDTQVEADSHPMSLTLTYLHGNDGDNSGSLESPWAGSANTGNLFRFDDAADQFIYNRTIQGLNRGIWKLTASATGATDGVAYFKIV